MLLCDIIPKKYYRNSDFWVRFNRNGRRVPMNPDRLEAVKARLAELRGIGAIAQIEAEALTVQRP